MAFKPTPHPLLPVPGPEDVVALAAAEGITAADAWIRAVNRREKIIENETVDPMNHGWEPVTWTLCDAMMEWPWIDPVWAASIRKQLGLMKRLRWLLIMGGNRSGKSEYAAKRIMRLMLEIEACRVWAFHQSDQMSTEYQQPLFRKFMPAQYKVKDVRTETAYVAYKLKTGFSDSGFTLSNRAWMSFRNYGQDIATIEGGDLRGIWNDELVPPDWIETQELRLATQNGWGLTTFTPVQGYSPTVQLFMDGARVVRKAKAYLCPKDQKEPDEERALVRQSLEEILGGEELRIADCGLRNSEGKEKTAGQGRPALPGKGEEKKERQFDEVPRIALCAKDDRAIIWFHSADNPYGNPAGVAAAVRGKPRAFVRERYYGVAERTFSVRFPRFGDAHIVRPEEVPCEGTNYMLVDPCGGRNFAMIWVRATRDADFVFMEWPGQHVIPGVGVLGPWALPSGNPRERDGKRGEGQRPLGWGLAAYKREIARLEGWGWVGRKEELRIADCGLRNGEETRIGRVGDGGRLLGDKRPESKLARFLGGNKVDSWFGVRGSGRSREGTGGGERIVPMWQGEIPAGMSETDWIASWPDPSTRRGKQLGARANIVVMERYMDSRFGNSGTIGKMGIKTLIEEFSEIGLEFLPTQGGETGFSIDEGATMITNALDWNEDKPMDYLNRPHAYVSSECKNVIFALQVWTGQDGQRGATKDFIDLLRYYYLLGLGLVTKGMMSSKGGGAY